MEITKLTAVGEKIEITDAMRATARLKASEMPPTLKNSILDGGGYYVAFLGEEIAKEYLGRYYTIIPINTFDNDLSILFPDSETPITIEVKTKNRTVDPVGDYNATVAIANTKQKTDFYLFVSLTRRGDKKTGEFIHGHVIAMIDPSEFKSKALFYKEGEIEPGTNFAFTADSLNMKFTEMSDGCVIIDEPREVERLRLDALAEKQLNRIRKRLASKA